MGCLERTQKLCSNSKNKFAMLTKVFPRDNSQTVVKINSRAVIQTCKNRSSIININTNTLHLSEYVKTNGRGAAHRFMRANPSPTTKQN